MARPMPWEASDQLPWRAFTSPIAQWDVLPSFAVGEVLFVVLAAIALWHAVRTGRDHVLIWLGALIAGTANDFIFMALPLVDNFWQAQAMVMLTPRMPLYIPCVYVCFLYLPTVAVRRLEMAPLPTAALTGLCAILFYAPYDIIGAKFLWWTWHDTDKPIAMRILGAPCSSSLWVLTFAGTFAWLVARTLRGVQTVTRLLFARGIGVVAAFTTLLMMVQMTALQQLDGGTPGYVALGGGLLIYAALAFVGRRTASPRSVTRYDRTLSWAITAHLLGLTVIMAAFDPATHVSTGVHQLPGKCYVEATDITGATRHAFLCAADFDEDYTFACAAPPADEAEWYTICGKPHSHRALWFCGVFALCLGGMLAFGRMLRQDAVAHP